MYRIFSILVIALLAVSPLCASPPIHLGEEHGPRPGPGGGGGGGGGGHGPQVDPGVVQTQVYSSLEAIRPKSPHFAKASFEAITEALKKKLQFAPYLEVVANRGSFQTAFTVPVPANFSPIKSLSFNYDSQNDQEGYFGIGWSLSLPMIESSFRGKEYAPYIVHGLGNGELVYVPEEQALVEMRRDLITRLLKAAFINAPVGRLTPYRAFIDETGHSFVAVSDQHDNHLGFVVSTLSGDQYLFDKDGYLNYASNVLGYGPYFDWSQGTLLHMYYDSWAIEFIYEKLKREDVNLPAFQQGFFADLSEKLVGIKYLDFTKFTEELSEAPSRTIHFSYNSQNRYLSKVAYAGAKFPIFHGSYQLLKDDLQLTSNEFSPKDNKLPLLSYRDNLQVITKDPNSNVQEIYVDLDNDFIVDKVVIDQSKKNSFIKNRLNPPDFYGPKYNNRIDYSNGTTGIYPLSWQTIDGILNQEFNQRNPTELSFYKGKLAADGKTVDFESDNSFFDIKGWSYEPHTFIVYRKDKNIGDNLHLSIPVLATYQHALHFIDLNGDGKKDLIYCQGDPKFAYENKDEERRPSLLIEDILRNVTGDKYLFSSASPWPKNRDSMPVARPTLDSEGAIPLLAYQDVIPKVEDVIAVSPKSFSSKGALVATSEFKCHAYSIFHDFNQDGIVDVLTGHTLYLRGKTASQVKKITNYSLAKYFNVSVRSLENLMMADLTNDGRLTIFNGRGVEHNPIDGETYIIKDGSTERKRTLKNKILLSKLTSPFGGTISVQYKWTDGVITVASIIKDPNADYVHVRSGDDYDTPLSTHQPVVKEVYSFAQKLLDPFTRQFVGFRFSKLEKSFLEEDANETHPKKIIEHEFNNGLGSLLNTRYLSRGLLLGKPSLKRIRGEDSVSGYEESLFHFGITQLYGGQVLLSQLLKSESKRYDNEGLLVSSVYAKTSRDNFAWRFFPLQEKREKNGNVVNVVLYDFDEHNYLRYPIRESVFVNGKLGRHEVSFQVDKDKFPGSILSYSIGDKKQSYEYDEYGRVVQMQAQNGYTQKFEYHEMLPLLQSVTDSSGTSFATYDTILSEVLSITTPLGVTYNYTYSPEGILEKLTKGSLILYELKLPSYSPSYRNQFLEHVLSF
ncbi:MAG: hypothetical protein HQK50_18890, partial [Oligoflexia bacterium]|nr:hypothetical protein [Oligoflexia bacterium]